MKKYFILLFSLIILLLHATVVQANDYYVSNSGDDSNSGLSPLKPWKTMAKVNKFIFKPGDKICFEKGGVWRDSLIVQSGSPNAYVEYTSFGLGSKPLLLGSIQKNKTSDWKKLSENIWTLAGNINQSSKISELTPRIKIWKQDGANVKTNISIDNDKKTSYQIQCLAAGDSRDDIQLKIGGIKIEQGKSYKLTFKAKCSQDFSIPSIEILKSNYPWSDCTYIQRGKSPLVTNEWQDFSLIYIPSVNDLNALLVYHLGKSFPRNAVLSIKDIKFFEFNDNHTYYDVGNIILNNTKIMGNKVSKESQLKIQNQFFYDSAINEIRMFSRANPASLYSSIEIALRRDIIDVSNKSYVNINGLALKYGGACGIYGENASQIKISDCDISFIGGGYINYRGKTVRYGNGINFFNENHDIDVVGCEIWDIYDTGITNQGDRDGNKQFNISYRNNIIWNCEYSFEYWNLGSNSETHDLYFENNICKDAGLGWSHNQREIKNGIHVLFSTNTAKTSKIFIRHNVFDNALKTTIYLAPQWKGLEGLVLDNNTYIQPPKGYLIWHGNTVFMIEDFKGYQTHLKKDILSKAQINENKVSEENREIQKVEMSDKTNSLIKKLVMIVKIKSLLESILK